MNRVIRIVVYVLWGIFSFLVLLYLTFPTGTLREVAQAQVTARTGGQQRLEIDDLSLAGLTGVSAEGVRLLPAAVGDGATGGAGGGGVTGEEAGPPTINLPTTVDALRVTASPLSLLAGDPAIDFEATIGGGVFYGSCARDSDSAGVHVIEFSSQDLPLARVGILGSLTGTTMSGTLTGHTVLRSAQAGCVELLQLLFIDPFRVISSGEIDLVVSDLVRGPGPLPIPGLPTPPYLETPTRLGQLRVEANLDGSELNIQTFESIGGPDVEFRTEGRISFRTPPGDSSLFLTLYLGFSEEWKNANGLDASMRSIPLLRESCTADNQCAIALRGVARQLRPQPLRGGQ